MVRLAQSVLLFFFAPLFAVSCTVPSFPSSPVERDPERRPIRIDVEPSVALGTFRVDPDGGSASEADGVVYQVRGEIVHNAIGGGVRIWGMVAEDEELDLLGPNTDAGTFGFFGHFTARPTAGPVEFPMRIGLVLETLHFDDDEGAGQTDLNFTSFGAQFEFMPEVNIHVGQDVTLSFYAGGHVGSTFTAVTLDNSVFDETDASTSLRYGLAVGARFAIRRFGGAIGYVYQVSDIDETTFEDVPTQPTLPGLTTEFQGIQLSATLSW